MFEDEEIEDDEIYALSNIPFPPSDNHAYVTSRCGKYRVLSGEGKKYKQRVAYILDEFGHTTQLRERVRQWGQVNLMFMLYAPNWLTKDGRPNKNAGDGANRCKLLQDVIFEAIGIDDCCIFTGPTPIKVYGENREVTVTISKNDTYTHGPADED